MDAERNTDMATAIDSGHDAPASLRRHPDFYKFWGGQAISVFGSHITEVALPLTAVLFLHATAAQMGLLNTARWLPFLLFTLFVGVWADRLRRRPLLVAADLGRALILAAVVLLAVVDLLSMPALLLLVFMFGTLTVVFDVAYYSYVPHVVPRSLLVVANSRLQATTSVAQVAGPSIGGVLVQAITAPLVLAIDAVSFLASAASLLWIRRREPEPERTEEKRNSLADIREGLRVVYRNPHLRALVGAAAAYNLFYQWIITLFVLYAVTRLDIGAGGVGLVLSADAVGALLGALLASGAARRLGIGPAVIWSVVLECVVLLPVPFIAGDTALTLPLLMLCFGLNGFGVALSSVAAVTIRQVVTPDRLLGRMTASYRTVSYGAIPLGAFLGGLAGEAFGLRAALIVAVFGALTAIACVVFSPLGQLTTLPTEEESDSPS